MALADWRGVSSGQGSFVSYHPDLQDLGRNSVLDIKMLLILSCLLGVRVNYTSMDTPMDQYNS